MALVLVINLPNPKTYYEVKYCEIDEAFWGHGGTKDRYPLVVAV